ncbi:MULTISPECIES: Flp family type IVb pilin [Paracoccaceae]|jgi:hypothetical protein|uniref:Pilus assembly protein n=1 Tax=Rhodophyticola porphyridii TaxID=1852017 RepID=A0A3L9Y5J4_9RHOB|nr:MULTISPECIES: pilus assembly protein [Paracoccaceae]MBO6601961.1 pilus assembly protein [Roseicyclus sp.]MBO6623605.1 pilus assembly protein [Roseicyclus sp.]MBO6921679.1 pilus assembly protein [Roseicyclus sp.]RMA44039.1 pilus assembly protein [Rhodophyticola porphyridii]
MPSLDFAASFVKDESGVVSVDWVVLTAALVGLGLAVTNVVGAGLEDLSEDIRTQLMTDHIRTGFNE